ncbi:MAG: sigma-E factor negative regulatory protein [Betaproteobacteria bacterium]
MTNDRISALMDAELDETAAAAAIDTVQRDEAAGEAWRTYHLIRDAMTDTRLLSAGFGGRMAQRLAAEPAVLAPARRAAAPSRAAPRRWLPVAAAASAAFALVGWLAFAPQPQGVAPRVAQAPVQPAVSTAQAPKQEPTLVITPIPVSANDYLLAHQGFSPRVSLQGMAPYVRTVSSER